MIFFPLLLTICVSLRKFAAEGMAKMIVYYNTELIIIQKHGESQAKQHKIFTKDIF
jgi:hypothetical protein